MADTIWSSSVLLNLYVLSLLFLCLTEHIVFLWVAGSARQGKVVFQKGICTVTTSMPPCGCKMLVFFCWGAGGYPLAYYPVPLQGLIFLQWSIGDFSYETHSGCTLSHVDILIHWPFIDCIVFAPRGTIVSLKTRNSSGMPWNGELSLELRQGNSKHWRIKIEQAPDKNS